ncbi:hypothetical protein J2T15_000097 [Paenibacillus harenae]|uniref:Uncharacterized protein n=1 Tax=Paenibacillus harenae TaxID=306543 RepID=A0ABT9TUZ3_PAEHA|nr:hypothetical protein [Paenibacillus harenae]
MQLLLVKESHHILMVIKFHQAKLISIERNERSNYLEFVRY